MTHWSTQIARPAIAAFNAYAARGGAGSGLHMDANESPWSPPPATARESLYARYPAQQPAELMARLAKLYGVSPERIMVGRGADEAIDILMRTFCEPDRDSIVICPPTFGYFSTSATIQGADILSAPLKKDFSLDIKALQKVIEANAPKIVFLCSPNNPTGNSVEAEAVKQLCRAHPHTLIVVDEAYAEFSPFGSLIALQGAFDNLVILRTLSKAYGLAGVRCGVALADPHIIALMRKVLPPYPVPRPTEQAVLAALTPAAMAVHSQHVSVITTQRARLFKALAKSPLIAQIFPSDANFILIRAADSEALLAAVSSYNIHIRDFRSKMDGCFRISVGSAQDNGLLLSALGILDQDTPAQRSAETFRKTNETDIALSVNLDDPSVVTIDTGLGFFDHMLEQIARHGGFGLTLKCDGDLEIDSHHSVEDTALALGAGLREALGDKRGIGRYGFTLPMDESKAEVAIDLSGRPAFVFKGAFPTEAVGEFAAEMCPHFFQSLSQSLGAAIHIQVEGDNTHHMIEACFKGVGRALRPALSKGNGGSKVNGGEIPSTKGTL